MRSAKDVIENKMALDRIKVPTPGLDKVRPAELIRPCSFEVMHYSQLRGK